MNTYGCCSPSFDGLILLGLAVAAGFIYWRLRYWVVGEGRAVSGHTIDIRGRRIRLVALCALQPGQPWWDASGVQHNGGKFCQDALAQIIKGKKVKCRVHKWKGAFGRTYARCFVDCEDIGKWLVRNGYAIADPRFGDKRYLRHERYAKRKGLNIHQGKFDDPRWWSRSHVRKRYAEVKPEIDLDRLSPDELGKLSKEFGKELAGELGQEAFWEVVCECGMAAAV